MRTDTLYLKRWGERAAANKALTLITLRVDRERVFKGGGPWLETRYYNRPKAVTADGLIAELVELTEQVVAPTINAHRCSWCGCKVWEGRWCRPCMSATVWAEDSVKSRHYMDQELKFCLNCADSLDRYHGKLWCQSCINKLKRVRRRYELKVWKNQIYEMTNRKKDQKWLRSNRKLLKTVRTWLKQPQSQRV